MLLLQVQQAEKKFDEHVIFSDANLDIKENDRIALVGRNGAGKSTLINLILGKEDLDNGQIIKKKGLSIGYLSQNNGLKSTKTIYEEMLSVFQYLRDMESTLHELENEISKASNHSSKEYTKLLEKYDQLQHDFESQNGYSYENEIKSVLHGFHFNEDDYSKKISSLSGGQKTRLALAKLLLEKKDLLILDEPTNHLDIETLSWLENYIQTYQGALLIVSHDRYFLDKIVDTVYAIEHKKVKRYTGNYSSYVKQREQLLEEQLKKYLKQQKEINKLTEFVNKNIVRASTTKRAQSKRKQLEKIEILERPKGYEKNVRLSFKTSIESGNLVLKVNDAAIGYTSVISSPINFSLQKHNIVAIVGPNGVGKSTLLKSILGNIPFIKGYAKLGTNVKIGYYDQEQHNLNNKKTVLNEIWDDHPTIPESEIRSILGSFLFSGDDVKKVVHNLSGGEKARLLLTKLSMQEDNFLILDEPTNHLDIESKEVLENALLDFKGTILFVSHDRYFINKIATSIIELKNDGSTIYLGDYDYYLEKKAELVLIKEKNETKNLSKEPIKQFKQSINDYSRNKERQKEERKLTRTVQRYEEELSKLESNIEDIKKDMLRSENVNNVELLVELQKKLDEYQKQLEKVEENWTEASLSLEEFLSSH